jgi:hypothetical protein
MSFKACQVAIEQKFNDEWGSTTPIAWPNIDFNQSTATWAELNVTFGFSDQITIGGIQGGNVHETHGVISVLIHFAKNVPVSTGFQLADTAAGIFREQHFSGIATKSPVCKDLGYSGEWRVVEMEAPFTYKKIYS